MSPDRVKNLWNPVISLRQRRLRPLSLPSRSMCTRVGLSWSGVVRTVWSPGKPPIGVSKEAAVFCAAPAPAPAGSGAVLTWTARGRGPERLHPSPGPAAVNPPHSSQEGNPAAS